MRNSKTFIYSLIDPFSKEVRYVGKSDNPWYRLQRHIDPKFLKDKSHKNSWIKSLLNKQTLPILQMLENCCKKIWETREKDWIAFYKKIGYNLTNSTEGGKGFASGETRKYLKRPPQSEETKRKIRKSILRYNEMHPNRYINSGFRNRKHSEETKRKIRKNILKQIDENREKFIRPHLTNSKEVGKKISLALKSYHKRRQQCYFL